MSLSNFVSPPPEVPNALITFPAPHVLLVTLNRPAQLNAIPVAQHHALHSLYQWYDLEPSLRCAVLTGSGRAFCAGADLKEWHEQNQKPAEQAARERSKAQGAQWASSGFGGLSNRAGKKPVIAAVNGLCLGGGMEMAINCDLVVAADTAKFGLPEVTRGVVALAGALPRVVRILGKQRASEMVFTGRMFTAQELLGWGIVNQIASGPEEAVSKAVQLATVIAANSPDAVIVSREGMRLGWEGIGPELATDMLERGMYGRILAGENMREGVLSFVEKRKATWTDSKL